tara:strand:+ start:84 stop:347 length:264 start_codon:yes stop_codon:yes gene_type:complete
MTSHTTSDAEIFKNDVWIKTEIVKFVTQMMENGLSEDLINKGCQHYMQSWIKIYHEDGKDKAHLYTPALWNVHQQAKEALNMRFNKN